MVKLGRATRCHGRVLLIIYANLWFLYLSIFVVLARSVIEDYCISAIHIIIIFFSFLPFSPPCVNFSSPVLTVIHLFIGTGSSKLQLLLYIHTYICRKIHLHLLIVFHVIYEHLKNVNEQFFQFITDWEILYLYLFIKTNYKKRIQNYLNTLMHFIYSFIVE